jgi:uncharacterized integral membrane protein
MTNQQQSSGSGKLVFVIILLILFAVAILQNTQPMALKFLFWTISMPRAILLLVSLSIGIIVGIFWALSGSKKGQKTKN